MSDLFIPKDPVNIPIRPLTKGMIRDVAPNAVPVGGFLLLSNYMVTLKGLKRRPGLSYFGGGSPINTLDQPMIDVVPVWATDGTQFAVLLTSRYLHLLSGYVTPSQIYYTYTQGVVTTSTTTVTGFGTDWAVTSNQIFAGDYLVLDANGSGDGPEEIQISSITNDYTIVLASAPVGTYTAANVIENGDCENASSPTLDGGTSTLTAATWARSDVQKKYGSYSWLLTKDGTADDGYIYIDDIGHTGTNDLHGLTAGQTYNLYAWTYTDAAVPANAKIVFEEYFAAAWNETLVLTADTAATWELQSGSVTLNAGTTGVSLKVFIDGAEAGKLLYVDQISFINGGIDYSIRRKFFIDSDLLLDWTVCDNTLVVVDHKRPPYGYNGLTWGAWTSYASLPYIPGCIVFFNDRLWLGNTIESGSYYRQRIRWSSATNHTTFNSADYLDLPYGPGFLRRLVPLGPMLVAYFEDAIFIGRRSNLPDTPYQFDTKVETRGIGLAGPKAVVSTMNAHFFVGQDDVYVLSNNGIEPLVCPVRESMISRCSNPNGIYLVQDPVNDRILLGFPETGTAIEKVWSYNYRTKAWSYDNLNADALANPLMDINLTWDDLSAYLASIGVADTWDEGMAVFSSWDAITAPSSGRRTFLLNGLYVYIYSENSGTDVSSSITATIETGDIDFDAPDNDKTATRLTIKLAERPSTDITFQVWGSTDAGNNWKSLSTLTILSTKVEAKVDFFLTGSTMRFRLTESSSATPYTITEMTLRIAGRGIEVHFD